MVSVGNQVEAAATQLRDEGYAIIRGAVDRTLIAEIIEEYDELVNVLASARGIELSEQGFEARVQELWTKSTDDLTQYFDMTLPRRGITHETPIHLSPRVFDLLHDSLLLDVVETQTGDRIIANPIQHVRMKLPEAILSDKGIDNQIVKTVPWHQDQGGYLADADDSKSLTVWVPLTPATVDNGCLEVLPGSHSGGDLLTHCPQGVIVGIAPASVPQDREPVAIPMEPGDVLFLDRTVVHRSRPNSTADQVRLSLDLRFQEADKPIGYPPFAPAAFLVRDGSQPLARDYGEYCRRWMRLRDDLAEGQEPSQIHRWDGTADVCA